MVATCLESLLRRQPSYWSTLPILAAILAPALFERLRQQSQKFVSKREVAVTVSPIGVQLSTLENGSTQGRPLLLPLDQIKDCVVNEVVLSHKVRSAVLFRVWKQSPDADKEYIKLVEAFPGAEMTHTECLAIRNEIVKSLQTVSS